MYVDLLVTHFNKDPNDLIKLLALQNCQLKLLHVFFGGRGVGGMSPPNEVNDVCSNTISKAHKIGLKSMIMINDDKS